MTHDIDVSAIDTSVWCASCSCGWTGEDWEDSDDALYDGDEHRDSMCTNCGAPTDDGEGWDGLCGDCADKTST